jgi:hypothetical protein
MIDMIGSGFKGAGSRYFWWELSEQMRVVDPSSVHLLGAADDYWVMERELRDGLGKPISAKGASSFKLALIERFPMAFALYLKIRRRFS